MVSIPRIGNELNAKGVGGAFDPKQTKDRWGERRFAVFRLGNCVSL